MMTLKYLHSCHDKRCSNSLKVVEMSFSASFLIFFKRVTQSDNSFGNNGKELTHNSVIHKQTFKKKCNAAERLNMDRRVT